MRPGLCAVGLGLAALVPCGASGSVQEEPTSAQVSSVEKARLGERIGSLSEARVEEILAGLRFQQASFFRG